MDEYIFYAYLKWKKEYENIEKKVSRKSIIFFVGVLFAGIVALLLVANNYIRLSYIAILVEAFILILMSHDVEKMQVDMSMKMFENQCNYCFALYKWLKQFSIIQKEQISELKKRISKRKKEIEVRISKSYKKVDKWLQVLGVPIVIAIIGRFLDNRTNYKYIAIIIIAYVAVYFMLYGIVVLINSYDKKQENRYKMFIDDLQCIIDLKYGVLSKEKFFEQRD